MYGKLTKKEQVCNIVIIYYNLIEKLLSEEESKIMKRILKEKEITQAD